MNMAFSYTSGNTNNTYAQAWGFSESPCCREDLVVNNNKTYCSLCNKEVSSDGVALYSHSHQQQSNRTPSQSQIRQYQQRYQQIAQSFIDQKTAQMLQQGFNSPAYQSNGEQIPSSTGIPGAVTSASTTATEVLEKLKAEKERRANWKERLNDFLKKKHG